MRNALTRWFNIHPDEITLFLWSSLLLFLIRSSGILFNNFAETAFLKRFGVEYLPFITATNSVATFLIMGVLTGVMAVTPTGRLLGRTLLFCGCSVGALRFAVALDLGFLYPILYVLKTQYQVLLGFLFSNLANDLFDTRQSKRIFPLITAGGIVGAVLGSFGTPLLTSLISVNNLMIAYMGTALAGAAALYRMEKLFPQAMVISEKKGKKPPKHSFAGDLRKVSSIVKESTLAKALILLTLIPNVVIPIINYQFSYVVDQTYATEGGMISFYGYFRGAQNTIALIVALFVGRLYARFGIPVALMFHPFNYVLAALAYLLRFDIFSAMYATLSTGVLRNTINNPARSVLYGLFPADQRAVIRPFLRGTVVRVGVLLGSGAVLLSQAIMHPRYLSVVVLVFVFTWIGSTFFLKRRYSGILLDLIKGGTLNLQALEPDDAREIFNDKRVRGQLVEAFLGARGKTTLWYAELLRSMNVEHLDTHILTKLKDEDEATQIRLLPFLSPRAGENAVQVFRELISPEKPDLMVAFARTLRRVYTDAPRELLERIFDEAGNPEVRACVVAELHPSDPKRYEAVVEAWLSSELLAERRAGAVAAGGLGNPRYVGDLERMLQTEEDESILSLLLAALHRLQGGGANDLVLPYLAHASENVRRTALNTFVLDSDEAAKTVVWLMGDPSDSVRELAIEKLATAPVPINQVLVESLAIPSRRVRDGIFYLAETLNIPEAEIFRLARAQLEHAYGRVAEIEALNRLPQTPLRDLLIDHLDQERGLRVENVLRGLAALDRSGQMDTVWRGVKAADARRRANGLEALDTSVDRRLSQILMPMLESVPQADRLRIGKRFLGVAELADGPAAVYAHLLAQPGRVTLTLTLALLAEQGAAEHVDQKTLVALAQSEDLHVRAMAKAVTQKGPNQGEPKEKALDNELDIPTKILHLRGIRLFEGLSVSELAAVASVTQREIFPPGTGLQTELEVGDKLYLVIRGEVVVTQESGTEDGDPAELTRIGPGESLGEMALFTQRPAPVAAKTTEEVEFLSLERHDLKEIVKEYPEIALHVCKDLSERLLMALERLKEHEAGSG